MKTHPDRGGTPAQFQQVSIAYTLLKKKLASMYNKVAPIDIDVTAINVPHHLPNTNPEKISKGSAKPSRSTQRIEKIIKATVINKKLSFLYLEIISLFDFINS